MRSIPFTLISLCFVFAILFSSCGTIKYASNEGFSGYYSYINPRGYYPFSKGLVTEKNFAKLWSIPSGSALCGSYSINDLGNGRALVQTGSGYSIYVKNANTAEAKTMKIKQDFTNAIVSPKGLVDLDENGIKCWDWETGKLCDERKFPIYKLAKEAQRNSSWLGDSATVSDNLTYLRQVGNLWVLSVINYTLSANEGIFHSSIKNSVSLNTAQVAIFNPETYSLTVSAPFDFPQIGNMDFFCVLEYVDAIKDDGYCVLGFSDGKSSHWYACVTLDGSDAAYTENGSADFLAKKFPDIYTLGKAVRDERQASANVLSSSKSKKDAVKIQFGNIPINTVTWYTVLDSGIMAIATPDVKNAESILYMLSNDLRTIVWEKPLNPDLKITMVSVQDGADGFVLVPEIDKEDGCGLYRSFSLVDGSSRIFSIPANLYILSDGLRAVDGGIINDGSCTALYDERTHEIACYRVK